MKKSKARLVFSLVVISFICQPCIARASEPGWWTAKKAACGLSPALPYNTWVAQGMPCPGQNHPGVSGPSSVDISEYRHIAASWSNKFDASKYNVSSEAGFSQALTGLYGAIYHVISWWNAQAHYHQLHAQMLARWDSQYQAYFRSVTGPYELDPQLRNERDNLTTTLASTRRQFGQLSYRERIFVSDAIPRALEEDNLVQQSARRQIAVFIGGFTRNEADLANITVDPTVNVPRRWKAVPIELPQKFHEFQPPTDSDVDRADAETKVSESVPVPELSGNSSAHLAALQRLNDGAIPARTKSNEMTALDDEKKAQLNRDATRWGLISVANRRVFNDIANLNDKVWSVRHAIDEINAAMQIRMHLLLYMAGETMAWRTFKKHIVEPQLKRIALRAVYTESLSDAHVNQLWEENKLDIFSGRLSYEKTKDVTELIHQARVLDSDGQQNMLMAADLLGNARQIDVEAEGDRIFAGLDRDGRSEVRAAMKQVDLPLPFKVVWEQYFLRHD